MSPRSTDEILIGPGTLYLAPTGTAFPVDPSVAPAVAWVDIGYSNEGWSLNIEKDVEDIEVAEEIDPVDIAVTSREGHVVGEAVQGSIENIKTALGGGTITSAVGPPATKSYVPSSTDTLDRISLLFRTKAPKVAGVAKTRDVQVPVVVNVGALELASKKAPDKTMLAIDCRILKVTGSDFFKIVDLT